MTWFSVRAKLLAFACIVLAPVALVAYFTAQNYVAATRAQVLNSSAATANVAVASADDFLATAERLLLILAATSAVQKNDVAETGDLFANTLSLSPEYLSLYVLDANDHLQVKIPNEPATDNDMRYGVEALRRGSPTISGRLGTPERLTAALAVPIRRNAQVSGALGVEFALDRLQRNLAESVMREHAVVLLFDGDGKVLVAPESPFYSEAIDWRSVPAVQAVLRGEQGAAEYRSPVDGRQWLGAYAPVRRANWAVLVSYPSDEVFAPVRMATLTAALSLGGVIVLALVMAVWLAARFTRPLQQVKATALSIAQGDYDQRVPQVALPHDEVGQLAVAFNQMADALHDHMVALLDAQREIEQKAMDLQQLLDRSVTVQEAERKRIAQEIHDGITQMLVGAIYEMQAAKQSLASSVGTGVQRPELVEGQRLPQQQVALKKLGDALTLVSETVSEIRRVIFDLHPTILDELGLVPALHRLVTTSESDTLRCVFQVEGAPTRLSSAQELALYRITQEALNNVRQHAEARHARVALCFEPERTTLKVSDDGRGLTPAPTLSSRITSRGVDRFRGEGGNSLPLSRAVRGSEEGLGMGVGALEHLGLIGMRERAQSVGGQFELMSEAELGTSIVVTLPRAVGAPSPFAAPNSAADSAPRRSTTDIG